MSDTKIQKVNGRETIWLFVVLIVSKIFFSDISKYINTSATAAYMQTAWCTVLSLILFSVSAALSNNTDIFTASRNAFGNIGLKIVGTFLSILMIADAGIILRVYSDIISSIALPEASDFFIIALLIIAAAFTVFAGIGTLTAYSYAAGIVIIIFLAVILILNIPNYDIANIYPVLGKGAGSIIKGVEGVSVYADIFLIYWIAVNFKKGTSVKKTGAWAIIISGIIITLTTLMYILTVPYPGAEGFTLPVLEIAFDVNLDVIFQRAEGLFFFLWIFSGFIVTGAYVCFAVLSFERTYNLSDRRGVIGIFLFAVACIALFTDSVSTHQTAYSVFYTVFTITAFALPLVVYSASEIRSRRR